MKLSTLIKISEIALFIIPGLFLSGIWVFWTGALLIEEVLAKGVYFSFRGIIFVSLHFIFSLFLHTAVWQLMFAASRWNSRHGYRGITLKRKQKYLLYFGVSMTGIGLASALLLSLFYIKGDFFQIFPVYSVGLITIIPAIHFLLANRANKLSQQDAESGAAA